MLVAAAIPALAGDPRDVAFVCPCQAQWTHTGPGAMGELTLTAGVRSFRATASGAVRLTAFGLQPGAASPSGGQADRPAPAIPALPPEAPFPAATYTVPFGRPAPGQPIAVALLERVGELPATVGGADAWHRHEALALWPVAAGAGDSTAFVDMLTDTDADGVGDVNEGLAGTSPADSADTPGDSTVDVLALYNRGFRDAQYGYPHTRIQHVMALTRAVYRDSGTRLRMRLVGVHEVELDGSGAPASDEVARLLELHGADLHFRFHAGGQRMGCGPVDLSGCASLGGAGRRGYWRGDEIERAVCTAELSALCAAHELGHNLGLAHSARQGEAHGAFRWSRGRYVNDAWGTIMAFGVDVRGGVFSDPAVLCEGVPCGVPSDRPDGAHAVKSLDLVRFQVAARRASQPDTDGDGIVDVADALPDDPAEWLDLDDDGVGDLADPDDDNDGVADLDDPFPGDPGEWEDLDGDGIGDNVDRDVADLAPFRDPDLREAVERQLGKEPGAPITAEDLATLTTLRALPSFREGIRNLAGLELATNLEALALTFNAVAGLSPIAGLPRLADVRLDYNRVSDLSQLAGMTALRELWLTGNPIADLSPLTELRQLETLTVGGPDNVISDPSPLGRLTGLRFLSARDVGITDLAVLGGLTRLRSLSVPDNPLADLSTLRDFPELSTLDVSGTRVRDLSPISDHRLRWLDVGGTALGLEDVLALPWAGELATLGIEGLGIEDLSPLSGFRRLDWLRADNNRVSDLAPLAALPALRSLSLARNRVTDLRPLGDLRALATLDLTDNGISDVTPLDGVSGIARLNLSNNEISDIGPLSGLSGVATLDLSNNDISDIGPLVHREIWDLDSGVTFVTLFDNPLDETSVSEHIPVLESWGVRVFHFPPLAVGGPEVPFPDPVLRALVAQAVAGEYIHVDEPLTWVSLFDLTRLRAFGAGVSDLGGLESAFNLSHLFLGSNLVADLTPLAGRTGLEGLDLSDNLVSDLSPLVSNTGIDAGDWITLTGNPLSEESLNVHVPALRERGVHVAVDSVRLWVSPDTRAATFDVSGYFAAIGGAELQRAGAAGDSGSASAEVVDGRLRVALAGSRGPLTVTVTGTGAEGAERTLDFEVSVRQVVALFPAAGRGVYEGFVRVINHSRRAGRVVVRATDDAGRRHDPVTLAMGAGEVRHFNSQDLEHGNAAKGLSAGIGTGSGDWRLELASNLDIEVLGYARTRDGFVTTLHDLAPRTGHTRTVAIFNPGSNRAQASFLRLVNDGDTAAEVTVRGVDDAGQSPRGDVSVILEPGAAATLSAADLEAGDGANGALGDGAGKWRLAVESARPVYALSLLESPTGHLTNLSSGAVTPVAGTHTVPLFPAAADADGREGFVRVVNRDDGIASVTVTARDDAGGTEASVTLTVAGGQTVHFNSSDLEGGNADKGLSGGVGPGAGNWRLALASAAGIDVLGYIRHTDGFLTSMHDAAPATATRHRVAIFNPGSNRAQVSTLRLVNPGAAPASVTVTGRDDRGVWPRGPVRLTLSPGAARAYTAEQLETGAADLEGALGDGAGKWRLTVESDRPIAVMSLLASPTGHLTNLSTAPLR